MVERAASNGTRRAPLRVVTERVPVERELERAVWIVEDEPAAASLAAELCETCGAVPSVFRAPLPFLAALRGDSTPEAVIFDWRLEHELSAALYMATRHRYPHLPVIYWTGSEEAALPAMIREDVRTMVVDKASGVPAFEGALDWALSPDDAD